MCYAICPITCARLSDYSANCSDTFTHKHSHTHQSQLARLRTCLMLLLMFTCTGEYYVHSQNCLEILRVGAGPAMTLQGQKRLDLRWSEGSAGVKVDSKLALSSGVGPTKGAEGGSLSRCVLMIQAFLRYCLNRTVNTGPSPVEGSHLLLFVLKFTSQL